MTHDYWVNVLSYWYTIFISYPLPPPKKRERKKKKGKNPLTIAPRQFSYKIIALLMKSATCLNGSLIGPMWHGKKLISTSKVPRLIIGATGIKSQTLNHHSYSSAPYSWIVDGKWNFDVGNSHRSSLAFNVFDHGLRPTCKPWWHLRSFWEAYSSIFRQLMR